MVGSWVGGLGPKTIYSGCRITVGLYCTAFGLHDAPRRRTDMDTASLRRISVLDWHKTEPSTIVACNVNISRISTSDPLRPPFSLTILHILRGSRFDTP